MQTPGINFKWKTFLPFAVLFAVLFLIMPRNAKFNYDYKKGSAWKYENLVAEFDFPILKTEEQLREDRSKSVTVVVPYYKYSEETVSRNVKAASELQLGSATALKTAIVSTIKDIYSQGVVPDDGVKLDKNAGDIADDVLYIQKDKRAAKYPVTEVYKLSEARAKLLTVMERSYKSYALDSIFKANSVYELIVPNLIYDKQTTELVHAESTPTVSPTQGFVSAGQVIVSEGEIVTAEIEQMLDSYKSEYEEIMGYTGPKALFWIGNLIIALAIVSILFFVIYFTNRSVLNETNRLCYLIFIVLLIAIGTLSVSKFDSHFLYMVPFTLAALWMQAFFKNKVIVPVYILALLPLLIFTHSGYVLFVMYLVAGLLSVYFFKYFGRGWKQVIVALIAFASLVLTYTGFRFIDAIGGDYLRTVIFLFIGSLLSFALYSLIYLFERLFNLVSNNRLMELADTGNPLLRQLELKAPGTFQHSLQVMSMADSAARSIGANALLVRAGALYHDIGKMLNPRCFIENETLAPAGSEGYHSHLSYTQSAQDIIRHVTDGLDLAEKNYLPPIVSDFIVTHHGTSCTSYFYNKYLNEGGDPDQTSDFFYKGRKPATKEQVIVMLCDTIEAASRTLKAANPETYSEFVENIVASKIKDGQLDDADISLKQLNIVKECLKSYLRQLYHERVVYPSRRKSSTSNE